MGADDRGEARAAAVGWWETVVGARWDRGCNCEGCSGDDGEGGGDGETKVTLVYIG